VALFPSSCGGLPFKRINLRRSFCSGISPLSTVEFFMNFPFLCCSQVKKCTSPPPTRNVFLPPFCRAQSAAGELFFQVVRVVSTSPRLSFPDLILSTFSQSLRRIHDSDFLDCSLFIKNPLFLLKPPSFSPSPRRLWCRVIDRGRHFLFA